jgi:uncharacterized membrane protein
MQNIQRQLKGSCLAMIALSSSPFAAIEVQAQYQLTPFSAPGQPAGINNNGTITVNAFDGEALLVKGNSVTSISSPNVLGFSLEGINSHGTTVGLAFAEDFSTFGFVRNKQGLVTSLAVPGAILTDPSGINDRGAVVGSFMDADFATHGFIWDSSGPKAFDAPGATLTAFTGINASGTAVGRCILGGKAHAFSLDGSSFSPLGIPDALSSFANGINNHGQIVGSYRSSVRPDQSRGFIYDRGVVTSVDYVFSDEDAPSSFPPEPFDFGDGGRGTVTYVRSRSLTDINGINDRGDIVGNANGVYSPVIECGGCGLTPADFGQSYVIGAFTGERDGSRIVHVKSAGKPQKIRVPHGARDVQSMIGGRKP